MCFFLIEGIKSVLHRRNVTCKPGGKTSIGAGGIGKTDNTSEKAIVTADFINGKADLTIIKE